MKIRRHGERSNKTEEKETAGRGRKIHQKSKERRDIKSVTIELILKLV
jgi:hypothetical protein